MTNSLLLNRSPYKPVHLSPTSQGLFFENPDRSNKSAREPLPFKKGEGAPKPMYEQMNHHRFENTYYNGTYRKSSYLSFTKAKWQMARKTNQGIRNLSKSIPNK